MKKIFFSAGIILTTATVTFAQNNDNDANQVKMDGMDTRRELRREQNRNEVSIATRNQFAIDFPDAANVSFEKTKKFDEVSFVSDKKQLKAYYDGKSNLLGTIQSKVFADLPESAQSKILKEYPDYTISRVIKFQDNGNNVYDIDLYGRSFDTDTYFVELQQTSKEIVLKVDLSGNVSFFSNVK